MKLLSFFLGLCKKKKKRGKGWEDKPFAAKLVVVRTHFSRQLNFALKSVFKGKYEQPQRKNYHNIAEGSSVQKSEKCS